MVCSAAQANGPCLHSGPTRRRMGLACAWGRLGGRVQGKDELMMHEDAVLALAWSRDSEMLATADQVRQMLAITMPRQTRCP